MREDVGRPLEAWILSRYLVDQIVEGFQATAFNDSNVVVGFELHGSLDNAVALTWSNGSVQELRSKDGQSFFPRAVNNHGWVVGEARDHAYLFRDGELTDLGPGSALDVNDSGTVAGRSGKYPALWSDGQWVWLDDKPGVFAGLNSNGKAVGSRRLSDPKDLSSVGIILEGDELFELETPEPFLRSHALDVNDQGELVGIGVFKETEGHQIGYYGCKAIHWNSGGAHVLDAPENSEGCSATYIGNSGLILGSVCYKAGGDEELDYVDVPMIWYAGIPCRAGNAGDHVWGVNSSGRVLASKEGRAEILTPNPDFEGELDEYLKSSRQRGFFFSAKGRRTFWGVD